MRPYIHTLIMYHKQAFQNFGRSIKVDPVSISDIMIIDHKLWSRLRVSNIVKLVLIGCILNILMHLSLLIFKCSIKYKFYYRYFTPEIYSWVMTLLKSFNLG